MGRKLISIVDDERDTREGLNALLSFDYDVLSYDSATAFLQAIDRERKPDCILLDLRMPGMDGAELQSELNSRSFRPPIIFMSGDAEKFDIVDAWRRGAVDFLLKPFTADELRSSIERLLPPPAANVGTDTGNRSCRSSLPITRREAQVLHLLGEGHQQHVVAEKLGISLRTVKMYRAFLKDKLDIVSLVDLANFYISNRDAIKAMASWTRASAFTANRTDPPGDTYR